MKLFLLKGNICNIKELVDKVKAVGKSIYVHIDLMDGFARDRYALTHMKERVNPDGIITTKTNLTKIAKELELFTIQRLFIIDNLSLETGINSINTMRPNAMEILPGVMPKIIKQVKEEIKVPVIAGGLIKDKEDVIESLKAGALGVSTSKEDIWNL